MLQPLAPMCLGDGRSADALTFPARILPLIWRGLAAVAPDQVRGVRVTSQGRRRYSDSITRALDPSGREYFWIGGGTSQWSGNPDSDFRAVEAGVWYLSVGDREDGELLLEFASRL